MKNIYLTVDITWRDDKMERYQCTDFPSFAPDFITLYFPNFRTFRVRVEAVASVLTFFSHELPANETPMAKAKAKAKAAKATRAPKKKGK